MVAFTFICAVGIRLSFVPFDERMNAVTMPSTVGQVSSARDVAAAIDCSAVAVFVDDQINQHILPAWTAISEMNSSAGADHADAMGDDHAGKYRMAYVWYVCSALLIVRMRPMLRRCFQSLIFSLVHRA